jgi:transketolase
MAASASGLRFPPFRLRRKAAPPRGDAMERTELIRDLAEKARRIRVEVIRMCAKAAGHAGGAFSMTEIISALYFHALKVDPGNPSWDGRDYLILSKGHAVPALHAALAMRGFFPMDWLPKSKTFGSRLSGHASTLVPGIEVSTGSMGHGLSIGLGIALGLRADKAPNRVFVILGDGEMQEGSNWEAIMAAGHYGADHLVAIIDRNVYQACGTTEDMLKIEPLEEKFRAFHWAARRIDGHDLNAVLDALEQLPVERGRPSVIIAQTVKGKGVSFLEATHSHYARLNPEQETAALRELGEPI